MRRLLPLLLMLPFLAGAKKCGRHPDGDPDDVIDLDDKVNTPDVELQVLSVTPDTVPPDRGFDATVFGSGFEKGARVWLSDREISRVLVENENSLEIGVGALPLGRYDVKVKNPTGDQAILRGGLIVAVETDPAEACKGIRVSFALDSATLDAPSQALLKSKIDCFTTGGQIRVEGHCDERGTTEYNLALGSRRATSVERFLVANGVPPSRIRTITYGEERPVVRGSDESAYAQNRRAEITIQN